MKPIDLVYQWLLEYGYDRYISVNKPSHNLRDSNHCIYFCSRILCWDNTNDPTILWICNNDIEPGAFHSIGDPELFSQLEKTVTYWSNKVGVIWAELLPNQRWYYFRQGPKVMPIDE